MADESTGTPGFDPGDEETGGGGDGGRVVTAALSIALCLPHISISVACGPQGGTTVAGGGGLTLVKSDDSASERWKRGREGAWFVLNILLKFDILVRVDKLMVFFLFFF